MDSGRCFLCSAQLTHGHYIHANETICPNCRGRMIQGWSEEKIRESAAKLSWYCGEMKSEPVIKGNRVTEWRYVVVDGCGKLNRPFDDHCWNCLKERKSRGERGKERAGY